jgi:tetratricopeptide (TPR) repeat protein
LEVEAAGRAGIFEPGGALRFAIVGATLDDELPLVKRSRQPRAAQTLLADLRLQGFAASTAIQCARIDLLVGDLSTAEEELRRAGNALASIGETYLLSPLAALLAQVVSAQGRVDEAEEFSRAAEELAASDDAKLQALWPSVRDKALRWQERADEAERRGREAVELIRTRAALSRLTAAYSHEPSTDNDRPASDRRASTAGGCATQLIAEKLDEHVERIVDVFIDAIEAEKLYLDNEGGVHLAPTHGVRLRAAIAAIEQAHGRPVGPNNWLRP